MTSFGDVSQSVLQVRQGFGFSYRDDLGLVEVTGPDALTFLQNRTTHDVQALGVGSGHLNTILDRSAHVQAVFSLHRTESGCWLLLEKDKIPHLIAEMEKYHIMETFSITPRTESYQLFSVEGPLSTEFLSQVTGQSLRELETLSEYAIQTLHLQNLTGGYMTRRSFSGEIGFCGWIPKEQTELFQSLINQALSLYPGQFCLMEEPVRETLRVEAGLPQMGVDMDFKTLLPETGLEQSAVSYTKGCYLGQETVARVKTYGSVQKALVGLLLDPSLSKLPPSNKPCLVHGKEVGTVKSCLYSPTLQQPIAMAYLHREYRTPGQILSFEVEGVPYSATVTLLPFYKRKTLAEKALILLQQGLAFFAQGQEEQAVAALREAIEWNPTLADAYEALGVILSRQEHYEEAIALMHRLTEVDPDRVMAHTNLSIYYLKLGDKDRAEEEKAKATVLAMKKAAREKGLLQTQQTAQQETEKRLRERIQLFEQALVYAPQDPLTHFGLGSALLELGEFAPAVAAFQTALAGNPNHTAAYLALGKALEGANRFEEAMSIYQKGMEVAAKRGDRMPLHEMDQRLQALPIA